MNKEIQGVDEPSFPGTVYWGPTSVCKPEALKSGTDRDAVGNRTVVLLEPSCRAALQTGVWQQKQSMTTTEVVKNKVPIPWKMIPYKIIPYKSFAERNGSSTPCALLYHDPAHFSLGRLTDEQRKRTRFDKRLLMWVTEVYSR